MRRTIDHPMVWIGLFLLCVGFHQLCSFSIHPQASLDAGYYHIVADRWLQGQGLTEPFIWQYLKPYTATVHPIDYWMPLGILLYAGSRSWFGIPGEIGINHFLWALLAVLVFRESLRLSRKAWPAFLAFCLVAFGGKFAFYVSTTDNIVFYAFLGFVLLRWLSWNGDDAQGRLQGAGTGLVTGFMALTRIDGLFFAALSWVIWVRRRAWMASVLFVFFFSIIVFPWVWRNSQVFGVPWTSTPKALFLREYNDLFEPFREISWEQYSKDGWGWILKHKLRSLRRNLVDCFLVPNMIFLLPFWVSGIIIGWKNGGKLVLFFSLVFWFLNGALFTTQSTKGTAFHISAALFPHGSLCIAIGIQDLVERIFSRWSRDFKRFMYIFLALSIIGFSVIATWIIRNNYDPVLRSYQTFFSRNPIPKGERIISCSPIYVHLFGGFEGVTIPTSQATAALDLAERYQGTYILFDTRDFDFDIAGLRLPGWDRISIRIPLILWKKRILPATGACDLSAPDEESHE